MKFTLKCEQYEYNDYSGDRDRVNKVITHEFEEVGVPEILENVEQFLRGCGYTFKGIVDVVDEEYNYDPVDDTPDNLDMISIDVHDPNNYGDVNFDFSKIPQNNWPFGDMKPTSDCVSER